MYSCKVRELKVKAFEVNYHACGHGHFFVVEK